MTTPEQYSAYDASNPSTSPAVLAQIAEHRPELRALVAANPSTPTGVAEWLGGLGDVAVDAALRRRADAGAAPSGAPGHGAFPGAPATGTGAGTTAWRQPEAGRDRAYGEVPGDETQRFPLAGQAGGFGQQSGQWGQPGGATQPLGGGQEPGQWGQPGRFAQAGGTPGQPGLWGQPGGTAGQPGPWGQPGGGQQAGQWGQPGGFTQPGSYGAAYGQPTGDPQPGQWHQQAGQAGYGYAGGQPAGPWTTAQPGRSGAAVKWIVVGAVAAVGLVVAAVVALVASGPDSYGDDPAFDALWDSCEAGVAQACDDLYTDSPLGSEYEDFGASCGGRFPGTDRYCTELM